MIQWREAHVVGVGRKWPGVLELLVDVDGWYIDPSDPSNTRATALAYTDLVGRPEPGDMVLVNSTAVERGLGTGGYLLVIAVPGRLPPDHESGPGHLVKARYTPLQAMVLGVDEQESPHHAVLQDADDLFGMPVVVADLHSSLPAVLAGMRASMAAAPRVAYVMSDGGALPAWFSRSVADLRTSGWLDLCITAGQAFGGDLEAVSVHSGLLAARHVASADVAIVIQGPGNLGTGTRWGFSGVAAGEAVNAAAVLNGRPIACLRISGADPRGRHRGVSHHSLTAYGRVALAPADIVVPDFASLPTGGDDAGLAGVAALMESQLPALVAPTGRHREVRVSLDGLLDVLATTPVRLSTMGRGLADDPAAFLAAAAAGRHAASLIAT